MWDGAADCDHEWGDERVLRGVGNNSAVRGANEVSTPFSGSGAKLATQRQAAASSGQFCGLCGAWLGCLGNEGDVAAYVSHLVAVFREVRRVMKKSAVAFVNLGDSYAGSGGAHAAHHANPGLSKSATRSGVNPGKNNAGNIGGNRDGLGAISGYKAKDLLLIPARVAIALCDDGWYLRSDIIWHKPNPLPESTRDRFTNDYEHIFMLTKSKNYYYDSEAGKEAVAGTAHARGNGVTPKSAAAGSGIKANDSYQSAITELVTSRNMRAVWTIATESYTGAHFATWPREIARRCISIGSSEFGCCASCGSPWARTIKKTPGTPDSFKGSTFTNGKTGALHEDQGAGPRYVSQPDGWHPTCKCLSSNLITVPATVLDPFAGSCTTAAVAMALGRQVIVIDRSEKYLKLGRQRILNPAPPEADEVDAGDVQLGLFAEVGL